MPKQQQVQPEVIPEEVHSDLKENESKPNEDSKLDIGSFDNRQVDQLKQSLEKVLNFIKKHEEASEVKKKEPHKANQLDLSVTEREAIQMLVPQKPEVPRPAPLEYQSHSLYYMIKMKDQQIEQYRI